MNLTESYIAALTGSVDTPMDWRVIDDRNAGVPAHNMRGTIAQMQATLQQYNSQGWGVFVCINELDGQGHKLQNVTNIRTHVADLDDTLTSQAAFQRAASSPMPPHFVVQTSLGKYHLYWLTEPYTGNDFYEVQQRKLAQLYEGDKSIVDATRVLRVPGFYHCKREPQLVTCQGLHNGPRYTAQQIEAGLLHVNVIAGYGGTRKELGDPKLAAPDWNTLLQALWLLDPNQLDRTEWLSISAAFKQAGWTLADENTLRTAWAQWCVQYKDNNEPENNKLWESFRDTEVGWGAFKRRTNIDAYKLFGVPSKPVDLPPVAPPALPVALPQTLPEALPESTGELLSAFDCQQYFKGCYFVERFGTILTPSGRQMNSTQFNGAYGGKKFIISDAGSKLTDEAWKAALRSTQWTIPKVDHIRFLPLLPSMTIVEDARGRKGLNTYTKARVEHEPGDVSPFLNHIEKLIPSVADRQILFAYLAYCVKFPGSKVPWAILFQSVEGVGKTMFYELLRHALGGMYVYRPKAKQLVESGSKFNSWMRERLMIIVDEIKVDERRELIEVLKPFITDAEVEIEGKGENQEIEDNAANWLFFSNHKDAIPLDDDGRRYSVIFSAMQTKRDLIDAGMGPETDYFPKLWAWLREGGGFKYLTHWLLNYPIEIGQMPVRAPMTTSWSEAVKISRSPLEVLLDDLIETGGSGFKGGYLSLAVVLKNAVNHKLKLPPVHVVEKVLNKKGYHLLGRTAQPIPGEDMARGSLIYGRNGEMSVEGYWPAQIG